MITYLLASILIMTQIPPFIPPAPPKPDPKPPVERLKELDYETAMKSAEGGAPFLVIISGSGCSWCEKMKKETVPELKKRDYFNGFVLSFVDVNSKTGRELRKGRSIPQVILRVKVKDKWIGNDWVGYRNADTLQEECSKTITK